MDWQPLWHSRALGPWRRARVQISGDVVKLGHHQRLFLAIRRFSPAGSVAAAADGGQRIRRQRSPASRSDHLARPPEQARCRAGIAGNGSTPTRLDATSTPATRRRALPRPEVAKEKGRDSPHFRASLVRSHRQVLLAEQGVSTGTYDTLRWRTARRRPHGDRRCGDTCSYLRRLRLLDTRSRATRARGEGGEGEWRKVLGAVREPPSNNADFCLPLQAEA